MEHLSLIDLNSYLDDPVIRALLALSVGFPTPAKMEVICRFSRTSPSRQLLGCQRDRVVIGCIGLDHVGPAEAVIHHIAVAADQRRAGVGRWLIEQVRVQWRLTQLSAETDQGAVDFYRKCGFQIESLGEQYPGIERFRCTLEP